MGGKIEKGELHLTGLTFVRSDKQIENTVIQSIVFHSAARRPVAAYVTSFTGITFESSAVHFKYFHFSRHH